MSKLIISHDGKIESQYDISSETVTIGRHKNNDICIDNLSVSSHHAQVMNIAGDCFVEDLKSSNGTYVNGNLIKKISLNNGDEIRIGKHQLKFQARPKAATSSSQIDFEKTMIIRPDSAGMPESAAGSEIDKQIEKIASRLASEHKNENNSSKVIGKASLQLLSGANSGKKLPLTKVLTTLGKPGIQVAAITRRPTGYYILHVEGGANSGQPTINGDIVGSKSSPLNNNDLIEVAGIKMEFNIE
ncbi:MAG: FHA domain-containing protein [Gammaproteobacteria bacterium]|nr:FHA domain-containing protein [Gammaproteobacteria bacterium]